MEMTENELALEKDRLNFLRGCRNALLMVLPIYLTIGLFIYWMN